VKQAIINTIKAKVDSALEGYYNSSARWPLLVSCNEPDIKALSFLKEPAITECTNFLSVHIADPAEIIEDYFLTRSTNEFDSNSLREDMAPIKVTDNASVGSADLVDTLYHMSKVFENEYTSPYPYLLSYCMVIHPYLIPDFNDIELDEEIQEIINTVVDDCVLPLGRYLFREMIMTELDKGFRSLYDSISPNERMWLMNSLVDLAHISKFNELSFFVEDEFVRLKLGTAEDYALITSTCPHNDMFEEGPVKYYYKALKEFYMRLLEIDLNADVPLDVNTIDASISKNIDTINKYRLKFT